MSRQPADPPHGSRQGLAAHGRGCGGPISGNVAREPAGGLVVSARPCSGTTSKGARGRRRPPGARCRLSLCRRGAGTSGVGGRGRSDEVWVLLSGGTTSLIGAPVDGVSPADLTALYAPAARLRARHHRHEPDPEALLPLGRRPPRARALAPARVRVLRRLRRHRRRPRLHRLRPATFPTLSLPSTSAACSRPPDSGIASPRPPAPWWQPPNAVKCPRRQSPGTRLSRA